MTQLKRHGKPLPYSLSSTTPIAAKAERNAAVLNCCICDRPALYRAFNPLTKSDVGFCRAHKELAKALTTKNHRGRCAHAEAAGDLAQAKRAAFEKKNKNALKAGR